MQRPCLDCGALTQGARCPDCAHVEAVRQDRRRVWQRGTTAQRGYGGSWQRQSRRVIERDGGTCYWCGGPADTADHLVPKVRGGDDDDGNLVAACRSCNSARR